MGEAVFEDVSGQEVILAESVRQTILLKHPETADFIDRISEVLAAPDEIRTSARDERCVLYYRYESDVLAGKWLVVVVKRIDRNYISTVYATDQIKTGDVLWKKNA